MDQNLVEALELIEDGTLKIEVDPNYIKGLATKHLMGYAWLFFNADWTIIENDSEQGFLTSDNPVAYEHSGVYGSPVWRYLPISPRVCLRIEVNPHTHRVMNPSPELLKEGLSQPPRGSIRRGRALSSIIRSINTLQIQCAEELVFCAEPFDALPPLIRRYGKFWLDTIPAEFPSPDGNGRYIGTTLVVRQRSSADR